MAHLVTDLRYGLRALLARPVLTLIAVVSLALGIGVNAAIYSLYHQAVLRPLPVPSPERLVLLSAPGPKPGSSSTNLAGSRDDIFSYPMFRDLERAGTPLEGIAAHTSIGANVAYGEQTRSARAALVSGQYFSVLGLQPALGRLITPADDSAVGAAPVAVLSHDYWRNTLGAPADVVGRSIVVNGVPLTVLGVAPRGFSGTTFGVQPAVFVPVSQRWRLQPGRPDDSNDRSSYWLYAFARLPPGVDMAQARSGINAVYAPIVREIEAPLLREADAATVRAFRDKSIELAPGARGNSLAAREAGTPLAVLLAAAALVLAVACLNIANLLLARGAARAGEIAVRASIGASRGRLVRQLLVEAALLGLLGALVSVPLAQLTLGVLAASLPVGNGGFAASLDAATLGFTLLAAIATIALFGLFPALQLAHAQPIAVLRGESGRSAGSRLAARFRGALAVLQVTVSMAALVLAGLFLRSLLNLQRVELGMDVEHVVSFGVAPERNGYSYERAALLFDRIEQDLAALPGVAAVTSATVQLLSNSADSTNVHVAGLEDVPDDQRVAPYNEIGTGYFGTLGIPLLAGRDFTPTDAGSAPRVAIVNRRFVERFGLGANPLGQRIGTDRNRERDIEIVGVVGDSRYDDVRGDTPAQFFVPRRQVPQLGAMGFYLRTRTAPETAVASIRAVVARLDPNLPVESLRTMPQQIDALLDGDRFVASLAVGFALLATLLAALGLYGVLSYTLAQRMREIGLRLALGAAPARVRRMVLAQIGRIIVIGGLFGLGVALAAGRAANAMLFELRSHDPGVLIAAALLLVAVALLAGSVPLRRVGRIDPMVALRHE